MSVESVPAVQIMKLAWLRDPRIPQGVPALGRFECACGGVIGGDYCIPFRDTRIFDCAGCGLKVDGGGWVQS